MIMTVNSTDSIFELCKILKSLLKSHILSSRIKNDDIYSKQC